MASNNAIAEEFALNKAQIQKLPSQLTAINVSSDCYVPSRQPEGLSGRGERGTPAPDGHQASWHPPLQGNYGQQPHSHAVGAFGSSQNETGITASRKSSHNTAQAAGEKR